MYHTLSSLFEYKLAFITPQVDDDKDYNHEVFNEEGEAIDTEGKLKQYILETDDNIFIGISSEVNKDLKLKLILEGLKISKGVDKGKSEVIFDLKMNKRKVFETEVATEDEELSYQFVFA